MKRGLTILLAMALLAVCVTAQAESPLARYYSAAEELLFHTDNVTVNAAAEFSLDGEWFKTAEISLAQDMNRSRRQLRLESPRADGTRRQNGWAITTEGEKLYLVEFYTPGVYRTGLTQEHHSLLRETVETGPLVRLGSLLCAGGDLLMAPEAVTEKDGRELTIRLNGDSGFLADTLLDLFWQFAAKRWFGMDYDFIETDSELSMAPFITVTQGLLWCTRNVELTGADVTVTLDEQGRLQAVSGTANIDVETLRDGVRSLEVKLQAAVSGYGTTMVGRFDPKEYDAVPAQDAMNIED